MTGILSVQGDFLEHAAALARLGEESFEIRSKEDAERDFDRLVLPGGESTVQRKLVGELGIYDALQRKIEAGIPVLATCAGLILLADYFRTLPVKVKRNAYGRQSASFHVDSDFSGIGSIPMTFIRAPCIELAEDGVEVKSRVDGRITGVQFGKQIGIAFHPELDSDTKLLSYWLSIK